MSQILALNCLVLGDSEDNIFTVEIPRAKNVSALKDAIKEKKQIMFQHVDADALRLWKADFPDDDDSDDDEKLRQQLTSFKCDPKKKLKAMKPLHLLFDKISAGLHLLVVPPPTGEYNCPVAVIRFIIYAARPVSETTPLFELNCLVLDDSRDNIFPVEIPRTKTVGALKDAIKEKKRPVLDHVPADTLELWQVDFPDDDDEKLRQLLENFKCDPKKKLKSTKELAQLFDQIAKGLHVLVVPPPTGEYHCLVAVICFIIYAVHPVSETRPSLKLNCLILGDSQKNIFKVQIPLADDVSALRKAIKEEKRPVLDHVPADALELWKVDLPGDGSLETELQQLSFDDKASLSPLDRLSDTFKDVPVERRLHIVVRCSQGKHFGTEPIYNILSYCRPEIFFSIMGCSTANRS
jgi:hypothetical protein